MGHQDDSLVSEKATKTVLKDTLPNSRFDSAEWIIQKVAIYIRIASSGQGDPGSLATRNVESTFADDSLKALGQLAEIRPEVTSVNHLLEANRVLWKAKENVLANGSSENKGLLLHQRHFAFTTNFPFDDHSFSEQSS